MDVDSLPQENGEDAGRAPIQFSDKTSARQRDLTLSEIEPRREDPSDGDAAWSAVKQTLRQDVGEDAVEHWIEPMAVAARADGVVTLSAPSQFMASRVRAELGERLKTAWRRVDPSVTRLRYVVDPMGFAARFGDGVLAAAATSAGPALCRSRPEPQLSFERFVVGQPNRAAYVAARKLAESADAADGPLLLAGALGQGKTHLLHAIANRRRSVFPSERVLLISGEALRDWAASGDWAQLSAQITRLSAGGPLLIDGLEALIDAPRRALAERFVKRCLDKGRLVAATLSLEKAAETRCDWARRLLGDRLTIERFQPTDQPLRSTLLAHWAAERTPRLGVDADALTALAERLSVSPGPLKGAYEKLCALADARHRRASRIFTRASLGQLGCASAKAPDLESIVDAVATHYALDARALRSYERQPALIRARRIAMYLAERMTEQSVADIGAAFGGRDPELVRAARDWVRAARTHDGALDHDIEALRARLAS